MRRRRTTHTASTTLVVKTFCVAVTTVAVVACGGSGRERVESPPSAKTVQSCDALCTKRSACGASAAADAERCKERCTTNEAVRKVEALRAEVADDIMGCITAHACDPDLAALGKRCVLDAVKKATASAKVKALCGKLENAFSSCEQMNWRAACTDELKIFADEDLDGFNDCIDRSCRSGTGCFRETEHALLTKRR